MSLRGVEILNFIDGTKDKLWYLDVLIKNVKHTALIAVFMYSYMFQQDNSPKNTAEMCKQWAIWNAPKQLKTPAQSPDLSPTEHLWAHLNIGVHFRYLPSKQELKPRVAEEWGKN